MTYLAVAVLVVIGGLIILGRLRTNGLSATPFPMAIQRAESRGGSGDTEAFDVFISYKSEDSVIARELAEQVVAAGFVPWFAEYVIPIQRRLEFMQAINLGVKNARLGLCLTNRRYFASDICRYELEQLSLPQNSASQGLAALELAEADHRLRDEAPWKGKVKFESLNQALEAVGPCLGLPIPSVSIPQRSVDTDRKGFHAPNGTYSLNLSGWDVKRRRSDAGGGDVWGPAFQRWFGTFLMWGHLVVGPQDARIRRRAMRAGAFDDREYYEEALRFCGWVLQDAASPEVRGRPLTLSERVESCGSNNLRQQHVVACVLPGLPRCTGGARRRIRVLFFRPRALPRVLPLCTGDG